MVKSVVCGVSLFQEGFEHVIAAAFGAWTAVDDDDDVDDAVDGPVLPRPPPFLYFAAAIVRKVFGQINKILLKPGIRTFGSIGDQLRNRGQRGKSQACGWRVALANGNMSACVFESGWLQPHTCWLLPPHGSTLLLHQMWKSDRCSSELATRIKALSKF